MLTKISINDSIDHFPGAFIFIKSDKAIIVEQICHVLINMKQIVLQVIFISLFLRALTLSKF